MINTADLSIACIEVPKDEASRFGIVGVDDKYNVESFIEKPANPPQIPDKPGFSFVNMGIYVFNANVLREVLQEMESKKIKNHDFGQHVIPYMVTIKIKSNCLSSFRMKIKKHSLTGKTLERLIVITLLIWI